MKKNENFDHQFKGKTCRIMLNLLWKERINDYYKFEHYLIEVL